MDNERVEKINDLAYKNLKLILKTIDEATTDQYDDFIAKTYAHMIVASYVGYNLEFLMEDANRAAKNLLDMVKEQQNVDNSSSPD